MALGSISFDGNNMQTANILTSDIVHEQVGSKYAPVYNLAHENSSKIPFVDYSNKIIQVKGKIIDSGAVALDSRLDTFRSYFLGKDKNLDIGYNGATRRYIATATQVAIDRPEGLGYALFEIEFTATTPFGQDTSATNALTGSSRTNSSYSDSYTFLGSAPVQLPVITVSLAAISTSTTNLVTNPDFEVNTTGWSSGGIGTFTRVTTQNHSGTAAGQMVNAASAPLSVPSANTYGWELYPISGLTPGATYFVSAWVKGNAGGEVVKMSTLGSLVQTITLTTGWQQILFQFIPNNSTDQIYIWSTTASATWFLDDVAINADGAALISIGNGGNGQTINVTRTWGLSDILVIDCVNKTVQVNGADVAFSGAFPEFPLGAQTITYVDTFLSRTFSITANYNVMYL